jgi:ABC-type transport system involved in multi-copper enzyme maturation permease subunit
MTWIVWRQQRALFITLAAGLVLGVAGLLVLRAVMTADIAASGLTGCLEDGAQSDDGACGGRATNDFLSTWGTPLQFVGQGLVVGLPLLVGAFVGAPLFAREYEQGTHALAFTQSVSRTRWMATKFVVTALPALTVVVVLQLVSAYWVSAAGALGPLQMGPFIFGNFDVAGVSPAAYTLFAYSFGVFAGALSRRTLLAMALVLGAYAVIRYVVYGFRESMGTVKRVTTEDPFGRIPPDEGWTLTYGLLNAEGREVTEESQLLLCRDAAGADPEQGYVTECFREAGLERFHDIIPADAVGSLHLAEASIFVVLSLLCVAGTAWAVRRQV